MPLLEVSLHFRHQFCAKKCRGFSVYLAHECILPGIAPFLPWLFKTVSEKTPVEDEVDVFRESLDEIEAFRQACAAFEGKRAPECRLSEEVVERPANPEVLFDDGRVHPLLTRGHDYCIRAVFLRQRCELMHVASFSSAYL